MKLFATFLLFIAINLVTFPFLHAKGNKTTIILLRHAEKDTTVKKDPPLTEVGKQRAERLKQALAAWKPDVLYSTATTRTMHTLMPLATQYNKQIQTYSANDQPGFAQLLKQQAGKTVVVAGHSNTIPQLANLLVGMDVYTDIPDNEFGRVWIITMTDGVASVVMKEY